MRCPQINISDFYERIGKKLREERIPLDGTLEVTYRCNLNCGHCYVAHNQDREEITFQEIRNLLDTVVDKGCLWLLITGGEPLVRDDFLEIYTYAKKKGLIITLFTNGTLVTPEIADYLQQWPPYSLEITLNGLTKKTYEAVSGVEGSFNFCNEGIRLLLDRKIPLTLKTTVTTINKDEFYEIKRYVEDDLGLDFRFDYLINPRLDGSKDPCRFRISRQQVVGLDLSSQKVKTSWKSYLKRAIPLACLTSDNIYPCGAGLNTFLVDPYARLELCILARIANYDLRQGSFSEGWYEFFPQLLSRHTNKVNPCRTCEKSIFCDWCPGWSYLENNDEESPLDYFCEIAGLREKMFKKEGICQ